MEQGSREREMGALEARVESLERSHLRLESRIESQLRDLRDDVKEMYEVITSARGSWRTLVSIGAVAAALVSMAAMIFNWLLRK